MLADILEALIGVVFLDSGLDFPFLRRFLLRDHFLGWMVNLRVDTYLSRTRKKESRPAGRSQAEQEQLRQKDREMQREDHLP